MSILIYQAVVCKPLLRLTSFAPRNGARNRQRNGASRNPGTMPCRLYMADGRCKYGAECKFSHETTQKGHSPGSGPHGKPSRPPVDCKLREWKRLLDSANPNYATVTQFFQLGLQLMDGDLGACQAAIKEMANDAGLAFIKTVTDRHIIMASTDTTKADLWSSQISPLFCLMTHSRLVDSNMLELEVSGIYNFLVGVNASRLIRVFNFVLGLAQMWASQEKNSMAVLKLSLSVLSKAIDCSTTNIINDDLHDVVDRFTGLMEGRSHREDDFDVLQANKYLDYLQRRLGFGKTVLDSTKQAKAPLFQETFTLRKDFPGRLSADGPRHDNDHEEIAAISIMPTYDEIMSPRNEYLPVTDSSQWHLSGIRGRLDREFRLLREDTVGQLRDAARGIYERIRGQDRKDNRRSQNSARTTAYEDAMVQEVTIDKFNGLDLTVRCRQPDTVRNMGDRTRRAWWEQSKRLQAGALTCVLDAHGMLQFFVVSESTVRSEPTKNKDQRLENNDEAREQPQQHTLSSDQEWLYVRLNLVDSSPFLVRKALRWFRDVRVGPRRCLVEFPGVLLASFKHTLEALQQLSKKPDLPFAGLLAPDRADEQADTVLSPPLFSRAAGFEYNLTCLAKDGESLKIKPAQPPSVEAVSEMTGLDLTQSESLINTLRREISLIQGPPGTGKSYTGEKIIQALLANKAKAKLGPIICVCFTNHALDQLLEHLLDAGIEDIIRMGSRSKSERLEQLNLRVIAKDVDLTKAEKRDMYESKLEQEECQGTITRLLDELARCDSLPSIRNYLKTSHRRHYDQLFGKETDDQDFKKVQRTVRNPLHQWLRGGSNSQHGEQAEPRNVELLQRSSLMDLTTTERQRLYRHWLQEIRDPIITSIIRSHKSYEEAKKHRDLIRLEARHRCLQQANIIGVTTTGMARDLHLLRKLRTKVVVCEEAGEVLEAHILTALLPSVEQLILIGDHLQLHPQIQNYELQSTNPRGVQYSLDVSLFERLVQPPHLNDTRLPVSVLETQRRMHPSISEMVRSTLYNELKDAENVKVYPEVVGMQRRLFWMNHQQLEAGAASEDPHNTSHSNDFEIEMATAMVAHLVRQGTYTPADIAVLTPYLGQLVKLRQRMAAEPTFAVDVGERDLEELEALEDKSPGDQPSAKPTISKTTLLRSIRLATVDNFQGEEAKIIIISLVRSNSQNKCGFLSTSNRINVLMSRAKHGCYILGNSETYGHVPMWNQIIQLLQDGGNFGPALELQCPRHPDRPMQVSVPDHFAVFSPDGGCKVPCDRRLDCGHACYRPCHSTLLHDAVKCHENCPRPKKGCDHSCPRECGEPCEERCNVVLESTPLQLPCGHVLQSPKCWESQNPAMVRCRTRVNREIPKCGHIVNLECHVDVSLPTFRCEARCGATLACGHACRSLCRQCNSREKGEIVKTTHNACKQPCGRKFTTCPHACQQPCHGEANCAPCNAPCEVRCSHSRCSKPCHEPCAPCAEDQCASQCPHASCSMPCAAPCDWVPCSKRCTIPLRCGHQCPSICGETCPDSKYCQQCGSEDVLSMVVDYLEMAEYKDIDLNMDPCVFPDCGHVLTMTSMDGQMSMSDHYGVDDDGRPRNIKTASKPFSMDDVKVCPQCRGSLRNISRYGRIVRRAMLDEAHKKFIAWSNCKHLELAERLLQEEQALKERNDSAKEGPINASSIILTGSSINQAGALSRHVKSGRRVKSERYTRICKLFGDITSYLVQVQVNEQPFQKVANLVLYANRQKALASSFTFDETQIQFRGYILATSLTLKCLLTMLDDFVGLWVDSPSKGTLVVDFTQVMAQCQELMDLAMEKHYSQLQVEGHIYYAHLCGLAVLMDAPTPPSSNEVQQGTAVSIPPPPGDSPASATTTETSREQHQKTGLAHIECARALMAGRIWQATPVLEADIEAAVSLLNGGTFYRAVTAEELRAVYAAMAREFSGTGHWYTCEMGHPFTVGECGMPMQQARCPECGSPVGGQNHAPAEGVRHATEIEELGRGVGNMRI